MSSTSTTDSAGGTNRPSASPLATLPIIALGVPGILLIVGTMALLFELLFGIDPLWHVESLTLSEAAALHDNGEVVRLINAGEDPNKATSVRAEMLRSNAIVVTPLEAAVGADRVDMMEVLLENGAVLDEPTWTRLMCFATSIEADDAKELLEHRRPPSATVACDHIQTPW